MMIEITTEEKFKHYKSIRDGYIVITVTTGHKTHSTKCDDVNIVGFREKVLRNTNKNGKYYFTDNLLEPREQLKTVHCKNCRPK